MAFGDLGIAKTIAMNAPKYRKIVEPFADGGTMAMYLAKKKPKEHIVNVEDETLFALYSFIQALSAADKKNLKSRDWVSSPEAFDQALAITATEGADLYYRYFYLKAFGVKAAEPDADPAYDWLSLGNDHKAVLFTLPVARIALKNVTLSNDDPMTVLASASGADTLLVLTPKTPEQIDAVEAKLGSISASFFYAKKSKSNDDIFAAVDSLGSSMNISAFAASTIMMATIEARTNYDSGLVPLESMGAANA